jgi:MFS family permease
VSPLVAALRTSVLRHRNFRRLVFGSAITPVALAFAVLGLGGSATELGLVLAVFSVGQVTTTLLGGVLGDRVSRQLMMEGSAAASAVVECVMAALLITHVATIALLTVLGAVTAVLSALNQPSSSAMTRAVVPASDLARAVALRPLLRTSAATVGFAVAGVLVAVIGSGWAIAVDAGTFAFAAAAYSRLEVDGAPAPRGASMLAELGEGFREVLSHTWLWLLIAQALLYHLFFYGAQSVLGPVVVGQGISRAAWGAALAAGTAGTVAGSLVCLRWRPRRMLRSGLAGLALSGLFPLSMAVSRSIWPILAGSLLYGIGLQVFSVAWDLSIQQNVAEDKLARVYSFDTVGSFIASPVGIALTGPVAAAVGFRTWLIVVACVVSGSSLLVLASADVRRLERQP